MGGGPRPDLRATGHGAAAAAFSPTRPVAHTGGAPRRNIILVGARKNETHPMAGRRSDEHTSELQSLMRNSYAVFFLTKKNKPTKYHHSQIPKQYSHKHQTTKIYN